MCSQGTPRTAVEVGVKNSEATLAPINALERYVESEAVARVEAQLRKLCSNGYRLLEVAFEDQEARV